MPVHRFGPPRKTRAASVLGFMSLLATLGGMVFAYPQPSQAQDGGTPSAPFIVRHDQAWVVVDSQGDVFPVNNDSFVPGALTGGSFTLVSSPAHGTAQAFSGGAPSDPLNYRVVYDPDPGFAGMDRFRYRLCDGAGQCKEADVDVFVRLWELNYEVPGRMDALVAQINGPRVVEDIEFTATSLVAPIGYQRELDVDSTPDTPWDSDEGTAFELVTLPAVAGDPVERRVIADLRFVGDILSSDSPTVDLYVGIDTNGNGQPDEAEVVCSDGLFGNTSCEFEVLQGTAGASYWVMAHSRIDAPTTAYLSVFDVPMVAGDGSLVATGPGSLPAGETGVVRISWRDDSFLNGQERLGFVLGSRSGGLAYGDLRVRINRSLADVEDALHLVPGVPTSLSLRPGASHDRIYFDMPANATRATVASQSDAEVDFYVARMYTSVDAAGSYVDTAPEIVNAAVVADAPGGTQTVQIPGSLAAGRWYVVPTNASAGIADLTLTVTVDAVAPVVRPGSYFNAERSGHGLFLYPAGQALAGIWYTYLPDGSPTWYYLQAGKPGENGVWHAPVYRSTWHGGGNKLTVVGEASVTPTGPDQFTFSYAVDGSPGTEPMASLGRGCPLLSGLPQDVSSHWFDPAHSGTGYSVQMWPTYEFYAAFVYDSHGIARYLLAERNGFGGADATLDLEQLEGFCPTCSRPASPLRKSVGTLRRTLSQGALSRIEVDGIYVGSVPGFWQAADEVQVLGGPGTTQGCDP